MIKQISLGALGLIASIASAQQATTSAQTAPVPVAPAAVPIAPATATPVPLPTAPAPRPATTNTEVATIVAREFPAYDRDANGGLSPGEFDRWMVRLKTIADPTVTADAPSTRTWLGAAFAQADLDRSRSVTLAELTGFLTTGRS